MKPEENPFAFPLLIPNVNDSAIHDGMTMRDYFAAAALTGLLAEPRNDGWKMSGQVVARTAYEYADDMLKARGGQA